ncbi:MAG: YcxB family protein [Eubacteriales bacterium]
MSAEKYFTIDTKMEEVDNRNYLYIRAFKQNSAIFIPLLIFSLIGTAVLVFTFKMFTLLGLAKCFALSALLVAAATLLKIEIRHRDRIKKDKTGAIGSITRMEFFDNYMTMKASFSDTISKLGYKEFYGMIETGGYYILYYSRAQATMLRKKDIASDIKNDFAEFIRGKFEGKYRRL